jgi:hypothetical protein
MCLIALLHVSCPQAEEAVKSQGFVRAGIFRPGMLDRGDKARAIEKVTLL